MALRPFNVQLRAYSITFLKDRPEVNKGGKIILPPSALDHLYSLDLHDDKNSPFSEEISLKRQADILSKSADGLLIARLHIEYPMLFKLTSDDPDKQRVTHCGVLEFVADEGKCYLPHWMMKNMLLAEGSVIQVQSVSLPLGTLVKFKPQSVDFLEITNPRAVLEVCLRNFACLTKDDLIAIYYNDKEYELQVMDLKPGNAVSIVECDLNVDFDAPVGYVDPPRVPPVATAEAVNFREQPAPTGPVFPGVGQRLDGKQIKADQFAQRFAEQPKRGIPNFNYKPGKLTFVRMMPQQKLVKEENPTFCAFSGEGQKLKPKK